MSLSLKDLRRANNERQYRWNKGEPANLDFAMMELAGETGEACNAAKKIARLRMGWPGGSDETENLAEELADVIISADLAAMRAGVDLDKAVTSKFNKTSIKHGFPDRIAERPEIVCISGSTRFIEQMAVKAWELEKEGKIALGCHLLPQCYTQVQDHLAEDQGAKEIFDNLHMRKIDMCDKLFVVNVNGYIGESCRNEIEYAKKIGKPVEYLIPITDERGPKPEFPPLKKISARGIFDGDKKRR